MLPSFVPVLLRLVYDSNVLLANRETLPLRHAVALKSIRLLSVRRLERYCQCFPSFDWHSFKVCFVCVWTSLTVRHLSTRLWFSPRSLAWLPSVSLRHPCFSICFRLCLTVFSFDCCKNVEPEHVFVRSSC